MPWCWRRAGATAPCSCTRMPRCRTAGAGRQLRYLVGDNSISSRCCDRADGVFGNHRGSLRCPRCRVAAVSRPRSPGPERRPRMLRCARVGKRATGLTAHIHSSAALRAVAHSLLPAACRGRFRADGPGPRFPRALPGCGAHRRGPQGRRRGAAERVCGWRVLGGDARHDGRVLRGPGRRARLRHHRLFCLLERDGARVGLGGPSIVVITGLDKPFRTTFNERDYARVRQLGDEYRSRVPRSVLR